MTSDKILQQTIIDATEAKHFNILILYFGRSHIFV